MPYVSQTLHIDRVRNVIEGRVSRPGDESRRLALSYRRSLEQHHLDPGATIGPRVLTSPELREIQQREDAFLRASGQCLTRLHDMIREDDYCVMLTDSFGVTIDYRVDRERRHDFKRAGLYVGSCWAEHEEGTCGVASVLLDRAPITVHKIDHFRAAFTTLTCSASPIFAPNGELIGVLDASAVRSPDDRASQRLINQLVRQSAVLIEDGYFLNATSSCWVLLAHRNRHYVEAQPEILIAFDARGVVVAANRRARECMPELNQPGLHASALFDLAPERLLDGRPGHEFVSFRILATGAALHARVRAPLSRAVRTERSVSPPLPALATSAPALGAEEEALRTRIVAALTETKWRPQQAAQRLGISRATLYRRIAKYQILPPHRS